MWSLCGRYALDSGRQGRYGVAMSIIQVAIWSQYGRYLVAMRKIQVATGRYVVAEHHVAMWSL